MSTESASGTGLREKRPDETFRWEGGEAMRWKGETCPDCGVRRPGRDVDESDSRIGEGGYVLIGAVSGLVALFFFPAGFGLISVICGAQLLRRHSEPLSLAMRGWVGVSVTLGMILGVRLLA